MVTMRRTPTFRPRLFVRHLAPAAVVLSYLVTFVVLPRDGLWIADNGCKFIQMQSIIRSGYTRFDVEWPGRELDPEFESVPLQPPFGYVIDGKLYAQYSPIFPLVSSWPYRWLGDAGLYLLPLVGGLLILPAVGRIVRTIVPDHRAVVVAQIITGLGSPIWFYSFTFWELTPAVCMSTWSVALVLEHLESRRVRTLVLGALSCSMAIWCRDELYVLAAVLTAVVLLQSSKRWRDAALFAAAAGVGLIPVWMFHWVFLGNPLGHHFRAGGPMDEGFAVYLLQREAVLLNLFVKAAGTLWESLLLTGPFLLLWILCPKVSMKTFRVLAPACILVGLISGAVELQGHLRSDFPIHRLLGTNSLFAISPILILAFMRLKETIPVRACSHAERRVWLITILYATLFAVIVPVPNTVGVHWGCRFLLILYPLFAVLAAVNWSRAWPAAHTALVVRVLLILGLVLSVITQVYSLSILIRKKDFNADFNDMLAEQTQDIVVTVGWFIPLDLARSFYDKKLFLVDGQVSADRLANRLHDAGYREYLFVAPVARRPNEPPPPDVFHDGTLNFTTAVVRRRSLPSGE